LGVRRRSATRWRFLRRVPAWRTGLFSTRPGGTGNPFNRPWSPGLKVLGYSQGPSGTKNGWAFFRTFYAAAGRRQLAASTDRSPRTRMRVSPRSWLLQTGRRYAAEADVISAARSRSKHIALRSKGQGRASAANILPCWGKGKWRPVAIRA
jgi:hypothetical protein